MAGLLPDHFFQTIVRLLQNDFHLTGREIFPGQMLELWSDSLSLKMWDAVSVDLAFDVNDFEARAF